MKITEFQLGKQFFEDVTVTCPSRPEVLTSVGDGVCVISDSLSIYP